MMLLVKFTKTLLKVTLFIGCFSCFLNCTDGTKSRKASIYLKIKILFLSVNISNNSIINTQYVHYEVDDSGLTVTTEKKTNETKKVGT